MFTWSPCIVWTTMPTTPTISIGHYTRVWGQYGTRDHGTIDPCRNFTLVARIGHHTYEPCIQYSPSPPSLSPTLRPAIPPKRMIEIKQIKTFALEIPGVVVSWYVEVGRWVPEVCSHTREVGREWYTSHTHRRLQTSRNTLTCEKQTKCFLQSARRQWQPCFALCSMTFVCCPLPVLSVCELLSSTLTVCSFL